MTINNGTSASIPLNPGHASVPVRATGVDVTALGDGDRVVGATGLGV
ncbi:hypothetical protein [Kribbella sp. NBC_00889]|nr:hypothetical protein OG817_10850 [Kribbella sp. NBC_00889]